MTLQDHHQPQWSDEDEQDEPAWWSSDGDEDYRRRQRRRRIAGLLLTSGGSSSLVPVLVVVAAIALVVLLLFIALVMLIGVSGGGGGLGIGCDAGINSSVGPDGEPVPAGGDPNSLNPTQRQQAGTVIGVGKGMNVPPRGWVVALATAMQESNLGTAGMTQAVDHDSLGLFQQRPSAGWGTPAQVKDPAYASTQFYTHLLAIPGWQQMPVTEAAQTVQRSAFPSAYAKWQGLSLIHI